VRAPTDSDAQIEFLVSYPWGGTYMEMLMPA
jgi:hypothetical protein